VPQAAPVIVTVFARVTPVRCNNAD